MNLRYPEGIDRLLAREREEWEYVNECFKELNKHFEILSAENPQIRDFHMFKGKRKPVYFNSWRIQRKDHAFVLCLIEYKIEWQEASPWGGSTRTDSHKYFFGYLNLNTSFGLTYIKPETLVDKINELYNPIELDFSENKTFSRKFYVLTADKEKVETSLSQQLKEYLVRAKDIELEFMDRTCLFRLPKAIDMDETKRLCEIGLKLDEIINTNS